MPRDLPEIKRLCWNYRDDLVSLGGDVGRAARKMFTQDAWQTMLDSLPELHARPRGAILMAERNDQAVGCGMIHPLNAYDAEIKRVYVAPEARGEGLGRYLTCALTDQARADGYKRILMDTTKASIVAANLYKQLGFQSRGPYTEMPAETHGLMLFFELEL